MSRNGLGGLSGGGAASFKGGLRVATTSHLVKEDGEDSVAAGPHLLGGAETGVTAHLVREDGLRGRTTTDGRRRTDGQRTDDDGTNAAADGQRTDDDDGTDDGTDGQREGQVICICWPPAALASRQHGNGTGAPSRFRCGPQQNKAAQRRRRRPTPARKHNDRHATQAHDTQTQTTHTDAHDTRHTHTRYTTHGSCVSIV